MRIHILSDLHHEERDKLDVSDIHADVVILAGDIDEGLAGVQWALEAFTVPVLYVIGNHEPYGSTTLRGLENDIRELTAGTHVRLLQNSIEILDGVRFLGGTLWSDYAVTGNQQEVMELAAKKSDFRRIRIDDPERAFTPAELIGLHGTARAFIEAELASPFDGKTVVVTHFGSSPQALLPEHSTYPTRGTYSSDLEHLMGPEVNLWVHTFTTHWISKSTGRVLCAIRVGVWVRSPSITASNETWSSKSKR